MNIITYAKLGKGRVKNIARLQKAALRNLNGFGGVKLFLLKYVTITSVTTAIAKLQICQTPQSSYRFENLEGSIFAWLFVRLVERNTFTF